MAQASAIEWTNATWNPVTGCTKISPGCDNCYAERFAERFRGVAGHPYETGFDLTLRPERLDQPLGWRRPRMIFVNSMSDLFHKQVPKAFVDQVFDVMERADWHTFQVLTKRSSRMRDYVNRRIRARPGAGAYLAGDVGGERAAHLADRPCPRHGRRHPFPVAGTAFGSARPAGPGGHRLGDRSAAKAAAGARPLDIDWVRDIRDQCHATGVAFFFQSNGAEGRRRPVAGSWTGGLGMSFQKRLRERIV